MMFRKAMILEHVRGVGGEVCGERRKTWYRATPAVSASSAVTYLLPAARARSPNSRVASNAHVRPQTATLSQHFKLRLPPSQGPRRCPATGVHRGRHLAAVDLRWGSARCLLDLLGPAQRVLAADGAVAGGADSVLVIFRFGATLELGRSERTTMRPLWRYGVDAANTPDRKPR